MRYMFHFIINLIKLTYIFTALILYNIWFVIYWIGMASAIFFLTFMVCFLVLSIILKFFGYDLPKGDPKFLVTLSFFIITLSIMPFVKKNTQKRVVYNRRWVANQLRAAAVIIRPKEKVNAANTRHADFANNQPPSKNQNQPNDDEIVTQALELLNDNGNPENIERAVKILENLAEKGDSWAQVKLSYLYLGNKGVVQNFNRAFHWATIAARNNNPDGLFNLGLFYTEGIGTKIDYELAYNSLLMASKIYTGNEDKSKCYIRMGNFVRHGLGRDINLEQALSLYSSALMYGNEDVRIKVKETQEMIARQNSDPAFSLEQADRLRWGNGTDKNVFLAIPFYEQAARLGDSYSQTELAYFYMGHEGVECDYPKAYHWATKASAKSVEANYYLAVCYHYGYGVGKNGTIALSYYMNFVNGNVPDNEYLKRLKAIAKYRVGCLYRDGDCGPVDNIKALEWFDLAQQAGFEGADKAAKEVRDYLEQKKKKSNNETHKLINCPACSINIRIPNPVPTAIIRCKACNTRLSIKQDGHGTIHVLLLNDAKRKEGPSGDMPMTLEDAARILGVSINDELSIIKNAWRTLRGQYHPDKLNQMGDKLKELAEEESKKINKAYQILSQR